MTSNRSIQLVHIADAQISELIELLSSAGEARLGLPCPGREKLGDGTIAATAEHTVGNYHRIADFLSGGAAHPDPNASFAAVERQSLLGRLTAAHSALQVIADLTDEQLDDVPPIGAFRFCDGQRTLEQVVTGLLRHQSRQIDALRAAVTAG